MERIEYTVREAGERKYVSIIVIIIIMIIRAGGSRERTCASMLSTL
jgi:hypothetical protein